MKFLLFTDFHHAPGLFMGGDKKDLSLFQRLALKNQCDFIIHAGDFLHDYDLSAGIIKAYNEFCIPSYHCFGNHDTDFSGYEKMLEAYGLERGYYFFDCCGYRFIVYDANYLIDENGGYVPFSFRNYVGVPNESIYVMPPEELDWLRRTIEGSENPCVLIGHESIERTADGIRNRDEILKIINEANEKKRHSVLMCINGHYHRNNITILDNVCYLDMNSVKFDWVDKSHRLYPEELLSSIKYMKNSVVYNDPLYAIITLEGTTIKIEGTESDMFMGVRREDTGNPKYDRMGRAVIPRVQSAEFTL